MLQKFWNNLIEILGQFWGNFISTSNLTSPEKGGRGEMTEKVNSDESQNYFNSNNRNARDYQYFFNENYNIFRTEVIIFIKS